MNYTTNYKLPQWVETDRILMEDFNQMCADIDAGLTAIQETAKTADTTASEGAEKIGSLETRVTAVEQDVKFVKLGGPVTTTADNATVAFSLAGVDMSKYTALMMMARGGASYGELVLSVNGNAVMALGYNNWSNSVGIGWLQPNGTEVFGTAITSVISSSDSNSGTNCGSVALNWSAITSVSVSGSSYAGLNCVLYGIKG